MPPASGLCAGEHLDERAFAGAVFTQEGQHFAGAQLEIDAAQRLDAGKRLVDPAHFQQRCIGGGHGFIYYTDKALGER